MKRKFIFLITLIFALGGVKSSLLNAQENDVKIDKNVISNNGTDASSAHLPFRFHGSYRSITQQIYTVEELTSANGGTLPEGNISKITFYAGSDFTNNKTVKVYIKNVDFDYFTNQNNRPLFITGWENETCLYSGTPSISDKKMELILQQSFKYDGKSNILVYIDTDVTSSNATSNKSFYTYGYTSYSDGSSKYYRAIYANKSSGDYDLSSGTSLTGTASSYNNEIKFTFTTDSGEGGEEEIQTPPTAVTDPKLNGLNPSESAIYGNPTTLSWTWGENTNSYQVLVGTEKENETTVKNTLGQQEAQEFDANANSYILNNLAPNTTYYWQVKSSNDNGDTYSEIWQFTTVDADPTEMVTKTAPANAASVKKSNLSFSWTNANTNHTRYTIYYKENVTTSEWAELYSASSTDESYTPTESDFAKLEAGKTYLWRVDVNNAIYKSEDTEPWSFTLIPTGNLKYAVYNGNNAISATVELKEGDNTISNTGGTDYFENITAGTYNLTVKANGFEDYIVKDVVIENGQTTNIDIYMPTILDLKNGWINPNYAYTNGTLTENNEVIVRANAIMPQNNITIKTLTIEDGNSLTISNGSTLTVTGKINKANNANNLIIEDGGQIFQTNEGVQATFNMNIINPTDSEGNLEWSEDNMNGWQLISSPFINAAISQFVPATDNGDYDLYKFDGNSVGAEWINVKDTENNTEENAFEENFVQGRAYLASYQSQTEASIAGTLNTLTIMNIATSNVDDAVNVKIGYNYNNNLNDFYLIGNPFPFDMDMSKLDGMTYNIIEGYAVVNDGAYSYSNFTGTVKAGDGFFIKTKGKSPSLYYSHSSSKSRSEEAASINLIATGNNGSDNLIISLSGAENEGFNKLENFNKDIATVFVVKNDTRYGIANFDNDVTMIDVAFEATQMGNYTIAAQPNGKFKTLTLVDRFTGVETNLLVEDYHFTATSNDNYNRFIVKLVNGQQITDNSHFAYVSGEELILNIEGSVEIIDMMGRIVYANDIIGDNNRIDVSAFNNAAYVVRVINENGVKVQKIIL